MRAILFLTLAACGGNVAAYKTRCGVEFQGSVPWTADEAQNVEDRALKAFKDIRGDDRFQRSCELIQNVTVTFDPEPWFKAMDGKRVRGVTYCWPALWIVIGTEEDPVRSVLAHELAHAIQKCSPNRTDAKDPDHAGWFDEGIAGAAEEARQ